MKPQLKSSSAARSLIKRFEPFRGIAERGDDGRWVVGYGHRAAAKPGAEVTSEEADLLLIYDVLTAERAIDEVVNTPLKTPQRDALVSFIHDIGSDAFRRSDVARYLFEGRAMAAGEALAIYGDTDLDRREAENALFMTAFAPPMSRRAEEREQSTVELVIKVEHPVDDTASLPAEKALVEAGADEAAESDIPLPPPPSARDIAARREAEDEISRILTAVGEMPLEALEPAPELVSEPAVETPEAVTPDVELAEAETNSSDVEDEKPAEIIAEIDIAEAGEADPVEGEAPAAPAAETHDRSADMSLNTPLPNARRSVFDGFTSSPLAALMPEPAFRSVPNKPATPSDEAVAETTGDAEPEVKEAATVPLSDVQDAVDTASTDDIVSEIEAIAELVEDSSELAEPAVQAQASDPAAAQVIARMSQEIAAQVEPIDEQRGLAKVNTYDESLPEGATLGFVIAGELAAHFDDAETEQVADAPEAAETAEVEAEFAKLAEVMSEEDGVEAEAPLLDAEEPAIEPEIAAPVAAETALEAPEAPESDEADTAGVDGDVVAQVHDVVEKVIASTADDTPPPHPAFEVAAASGAVGEVGADETLTREAIHIQDDLVEHGEIEALDDEFSPSDLAGEEDLFTDTRPVEAHKDRSTGWFVLVLLAGLALAVYGGLFTYLEWDRVWGARELTSGAWALIAGSFFSVMALWQLVSIWTEKRKEKAPI